MTVPVRRVTWMSATAALALTVWGCGAGDVGDECADDHAADECVEGAVCVADDRGDLLCRREARIGESCSNEGERAECAADGICGKDSIDGRVQCLQVCTVHEDCTAGLDCNGVEGTSVKGCRPKT